jgi:hypothetical protein
VRVGDVGGRRADQGHSGTLAQARTLSRGYPRAVKILHRIRRVFAGEGRSSSQIAGGTVGAQVGLGQIDAAERQEFPPEEFASDEQEESD